MLGLNNELVPGFKKLDWDGAVAVLLKPPGFRVEVFPKMLFEGAGAVVVPNAGTDVDAPNVD